MSGVFFTMQSKLARQIHLALALHDWKAFVENLVKLGYICNMNEINKKKTPGKWRFPDQLFLRPQFVPHREHCLYYNGQSQRSSNIAPITFVRF
jgi:hypothetical protein